MKFYATKKKLPITILFLVCVLTVLIIIAGLTESSGAYFGAERKMFPVHSALTEENYVALTFDIEYGNDKTEGILEILKEFEADATFFVTGRWAESFKDKTKKIAENFEIGTHSYTHPHMTNISYGECLNELKISKEKIEEITKKKVTLFRAPYGEYDKQVLSIAQSLNLKAIRWDVDSYDWKLIPSKDIIKRVLEKTRGGSIILFHSNSDDILDFLPIILQTLKDRGYGFKSVSDLIYKG